MDIIAALMFPVALVFLFAFFPKLVFSWGWWPTTVKSYSTSQYGMVDSLTIKPSLGRQRTFFWTTGGVGWRDITNPDQQLRVDLEVRLYEFARSIDGIG